MFCSPCHSYLAMYLADYKKKADSKPCFGRHGPCAVLGAAHLAPTIWFVILLLQVSSGRVPMRVVYLIYFATWNCMA